MPRGLPVGCSLALVPILALAAVRTASVAAPAQGLPWGRFSLEKGDVVAFLGGADVAGAQQTGQLEALLAVQYRGLDAHFRNFGWEGDTGFAQPRDVGFPPLLELLRRARVSVIVLQFGRAEALAGRSSLPAFLGAYRKLLDECARQTPRLALVTPPPFENGGGLLPDLSSRNGDLDAYASGVRELARNRGLPLVDL